MQRFVTVLFGIFILFSFATAQEQDSLLLADFDNESLGLNGWDAKIGDAWVQATLGVDPEDTDNGVVEVEIDCELSDTDNNKAGFSKDIVYIVVNGDTATALVAYIYIEEEAHAELNGAQIFAMTRGPWEWRSTWMDAASVEHSAWFRMMYPFQDHFDNTAGFDTLMNKGLVCGVEFAFNENSAYYGYVWGDNIWLLGVKGDPAAGVEPASFAAAPGSFILEQNYPNPFNPTTNIVYTLPQRDRVTISIYDVTGRLVTTLVDNEPQPAGRVAVPFNAGDLSSGIYYYKVQTSYEAQMKKMVLVR